MLQGEPRLFRKRGLNPLPQGTPAKNKGTGTLWPSPKEGKEKTAPGENPSRPRRIPPGRTQRPLGLKTDP